MAVSIYMDTGVDIDRLGSYGCSLYMGTGVDIDRDMESDMGCFCKFGGPFQGLYRASKGAMAGLELI